MTNLKIIFLTFLIIGIAASSESVDLSEFRLYKEFETLQPEKEYVKTSPFYGLEPPLPFNEADLDERDRRKEKLSRLFNCDVGGIWSRPTRVSRLFELETAIDDHMCQYDQYDVTVTADFYFRTVMEAYKQCLKGPKSEFKDWLNNLHLTSYDNENPGEYLTCFAKERARKRLAAERGISAIN